MKIIPAIDLMEGKVVRLFKGNPEEKTTYSEDPLEIAKKWEKKGADMIHLVDLDATLGRGTNIEIIKNVVNQISIPVEVAGGLRDESTISQVFPNCMFLETQENSENVEVSSQLSTEHGPDALLKLSQ